MPFVIAGVLLLVIGAFNGCIERTDRGAPVSRQEAHTNFYFRDEILRSHEAAIVALDQEIAKLKQKKK